MPARILIIEDNPENLDLMSYLLQAFGYKPVVATDGEQGLREARRELFDLILCDIQIPKMNGYGVARALKSDRKLRAIPIVAVTALAMVGDRDKILAAGFDGYIAKPIDPVTFTSRLESFLPPTLVAPRPKVVEVTETPRQPAVARKQASLLAVDDREVDLSLMYSVLQPSGYEVICASSVKEAMEAARRKRPDLTLCDVNMPGGTGFDLLDLINVDPELSGVPVILITSTALSERDREEGLARGAAHYLMRPIEPQALLSIIESCLRDQKQK